MGIHDGKGLPAAGVGDDVGEVDRLISRGVGVGAGGEIAELVRAVAMPKLEHARRCGIADTFGCGGAHRRVGSSVLQQLHHPAKVFLLERKEIHERPVGG